MRVEKTAAEQFITKLVENVNSQGSRLDDDLEEFVNIIPLTAEELQEEIELLFHNPPDLEAPAFDDFNSAILELMDFEAKRKEFIMAKKSEGMTLDEAKKEYDLVKASMVRQHLDIPEPSEEE
tara:strand:- start:440 stop:808 length:369 start_codon:yes stop_codon:yes gene_type:complete